MAKKHFWGFVQRFREKAEIDGENDGERGELRVEMKGALRAIEFAA